MRVARMKVVGKSAYYHIINRVAGPKDYYPFDDVSKEKAFHFLEEVLAFYRHEVISFTMMGNHYHLIVYAPIDLLDPIQTSKRHNDYYQGRVAELNPNQIERYQKVASKMINISELMKAFQQKLAVWYNRTHNRRGPLWADRFKHTILEGKDFNSALWICTKYCELNPVRAGLTDHPSNYRFCSWGKYKGKGKHPFEATFIKHMRKAFGERAKPWSKKQLFREFDVELARTIAYEKGENSALIKAAMADARAGDRMKVQFLRKSRYWSQGLAIGTKTFVIEKMLPYYDSDYLAKKLTNRYSADYSGPNKIKDLFSFRRFLN